MKIEHTLPTLQHEWDLYRELEGVWGVEQPKRIGIGAKSKKRFIEMRHLGKNLMQVFEDNHREFPVDVVLQIGLSLLRILEGIHERGIVHCDLRPENLMLDVHGTKRLYLIDFNLGQRWRNPKTRHHEPTTFTGAFVGTLRFASRRAHQQQTLSRQDDLESLAYTLAFFLNGGTLPWSTHMVGDSVDEAWRAVGDVKQRATPANIFRGQDPLWVKFLNRIWELGGEEKPDYGRLKRYLHRIGESEKRS